MNKNVMDYTGIVVSALSLLLVACTDNNSNEVFSVSKEMRIDTMQGSCSFVTNDQDGNIVLSWIREKKDSTSVFCYAISKDNGSSFDEVIEIPSSINIQPHAENIPKVVFKPGNEIIAVWGSANPGTNKYAGLVYYSQSFDNGKSWTDAIRLIKDTSANDQRYFDLVSMPDGEAAIVWLDNRTKKASDGAALYFAATDGRNGFTNERHIAEPTCECCRVDLFIDNKKSIHVIYRGIMQDSIRDILHTVSNDNGKTFSDPQMISYDNWVVNACPHTGPSMTETNNNLHFSWYSMGSGAGIFYTRLKQNETKYIQRKQVADQTGRHPQILSVGKASTAIVWDETESSRDRLITRIRLQVQNGDSAGEVYDITPEATNAVYPVSAKTGKKTNELFIAYTNKSGAEKYIGYRICRLPFRDFE